MTDTIPSQQSYTTPTEASRACKQDGKEYAGVHRLPSGRYCYLHIVGTNSDTVAERIFQEILADGDLIEDRREYDAEDLQIMYELDFPNAVELYTKIQEYF